MAIFAVVLAWPVLLLAQEVVEEAGPVKINWSQKVMVFTGDGAPDLNAPNAAAARLGAERAAYADALRKALEALKGIRLTAGQTVGQKMEANPAIASEVQGVIRGFKVVDKRYFSDGGVQLDLRIPLDGVVVETLLKDEAKPETPPEPAKDAKPETPPAESAKPKDEKAEAPADAPKSSTGLVVEAGSLDIFPALAPKIVDEEGNDVYGLSMVRQPGLDNGIVSYKADKDAAVKDAKVGENPMVVTALRSPNGVDLVVSNADAKSIREQAKSKPFLAEGRVIIVKQEK